MTGTPEEMEREIEELRAEVSRLSDMRQACDGLLEAGLFGRLSIPSTQSQLCDSILQTAEILSGSEASGLFLLDQKDEQLVAIVVRGGGGEELKEFRIPLDQGLVGYCAVTGEVILIENAREDNRWSNQIGESLGYTPRSVLCVPMIVQDEVIGVLQLLDKTEGTYDSSDVSLASHFSVLAGIAVQQLEVIDQLALIVRRSLLATSDSPIEGVEKLEELAVAIASSESSQEMLEIASLLNQIHRHGDNARRMTSQFLKSIHRYLQSTDPTISG
ncbi:MAG: GAF domain-containing protein [Planctomycetota bacterium]|jgi:GAF domain-containing protein|nr:GAF domain-containing protein [Planctomycetota bacterium]